MKLTAKLMALAIVAGGTMFAQPRLTVGIGVGGYAEAADRLDGRLAGALMSIPAIKGVEVGDGFQAAAVRGSSAKSAAATWVSGVLIEGSPQKGSQCS